MIPDWFGLFTLVMMIAMFILGYAWRMKEEGGVAIAGYEKLSDKEKRKRQNVKPKPPE